MRWTISLVFWLVMALARGNPALGEMAHPMLGEEAPDFSLTTLAGGSARLADYRGSTVRLDRLLLLDRVE